VTRRFGSRRTDGLPFDGPRTDGPRTDGLRFDGAVRRGSFELVIDFSVGPGEVLGVLGPNGAGKSTLLRAVAGLEELTRGSVEVAGRVWQDSDRFVPADERRAGVVFQNYRLFPHLDVRDNVAFAARSDGARRAASRTVATEWLERLGLSALGGRRPHQLSGGQAQRVALARALAREPDVLLLDEPMAALDAGARIEVRTFLREHLAGFAGPIVLVTHDPLEAMVLADRLLVVEAGRLVQEGSPAEVARRPASRYVARLVGLNLWTGRLDQSTGAVTLDNGGQLAVTTQAPGGRVLVSLRPNAITVHTEWPEHTSTRNVWQATIADMELLADRVRLQVRGTPSALVDITPAAVSELALDVGRQVWLSAKATEAEAYPDADGRPVRPD
jgi:molybdate transport system ATP-binding protein